MTARPTIPELGRRFLDVLAAARPTTLADAVRRADSADNAERADNAFGAADSARVVEVAGAAAGEPLMAPLSGRPCVWHRSVTSPFRERMGTATGGRLQRVAPPPVVPSSAFPPHQVPTQRGAPPVVDESATGFRIEDGDAVLAVDPAHVLIDAAEVTVNDYRRDEQGLATALLQEWIIAPGEALHAFGAVRRTHGGAELTAGPAPAAIVSSHDRAYLTQRAQLGRDSPSPARIYALILVPVAIVLVIIVLLIVGVV